MLDADYYDGLSLYNCDFHGGLSWQTKIYRSNNFVASRFMGGGNDRRYFYTLVSAQTLFLSSYFNLYLDSLQSFIFSSKIDVPTRINISTSMYEATSFNSYTLISLSAGLNMSMITSEDQIFNNTGSINSGALYIDAK